MNASQINLASLAEKWPSSIVSRDRISDFTGGLISSGTMANLDSRGEGPPRFNFGSKKVAYQVEPLIKWLAEYIQRKNSKAAVKPPRARRRQ